MRKCIDLANQPGFQNIHSPEMQQAIDRGLSQAQDRGLKGFSGTRVVDWGYDPEEVVKTPPRIANRTLEDIGLREKYRLNIITVEREVEIQNDGETLKEKHILGIPRSTMILYETDTIIVFGRTKDIKKFIEINQAH